MKKLLLVIISLLFMNTCLAAPLTTEDEVAQGRIGTWPGSRAEDFARARFPGAEIVYFETVADMAQTSGRRKSRPLP